MRCAAGPRPVGAPPATGLEDETLNDVAVPLGPQIKELLREGGASERASVLGGATLAGFIASAFRCAQTASKTLHQNPAWMRTRAGVRPRLTFFVLCVTSCVALALPSRLSATGVLQRCGRRLGSWLCLVNTSSAAAAAVFGGGHRGCGARRRGEGTLRALVRSTVLTNASRVVQPAVRLREDADAEDGAGSGRQVPLRRARGLRAADYQERGAVPQMQNFCFLYSFLQDATLHGGWRIGALLLGRWQSRD